MPRSSSPTNATPAGIEIGNCSLKSPVLIKIVAGPVTFAQAYLTVAYGAFSVNPYPGASVPLVLT